MEDGVVRLCRGAAGRPSHCVPNVKFFSKFFLGTREANASAQYGPSSNLAITFESNDGDCRVVDNHHLFLVVFFLAICLMVFFYQFGFCLEALCPSR